MSTCVFESAPNTVPSSRSPLAAAMFAVIVLFGFLIAPGDLAWKTHMALHGLCAQRPSHSLQIGGAMLPMDARMTGIYLGAFATLIWLIAARRLRSSRALSRPVLALLASFVVVLVADGSNALLLDLRLPTLYEPSNIMRLATGVLAGTSLGVGLGHLFANTMWAHVDSDRAAVTRPVDLLAPISLSIAMAALVLTGLPLLYGPFAVGLVVAAVGVFWLLEMTVLALLSNCGWSCRSWTDLGPLATAAMITAIVTVGGLAWMRFAAEQLLGLPRLT